MNVSLAEITPAELHRLRRRQERLLGDIGWFSVHAVVALSAALLNWLDTRHTIEPDWLVSLVSLGGYVRLIMTSFIVVGTFWGILLVTRAFLTAAAFRGLPYAMVCAVIPVGACIPAWWEFRSFLLMASVGHPLLLGLAAGGIAVFPMLIYSDMRRVLRPATPPASPEAPAPAQTVETPPQD